MKFDPKTEQQVQEEGLLPAGIYDFEVISAEDTHSNKGNEMVVAKLGVMDADGQERKITDYLLEAMAYKLRHFAYATGLGPQYEVGTLVAADMIGKTGQCKLTIQPAKGEYRAKNVVADYVVANGEAAAMRQAGTGGDPRPTPPPFDDDIPF